MMPGPTFRKTYRAPASTQEGMTFAYYDELFDLLRRMDNMEKVLREMSPGAFARFEMINNCRPLEEEMVANERRFVDEEVQWTC